MACPRAHWATTAGRVRGPRGAVPAPRVQGREEVLVPAAEEDRRAPGRCERGEEPARRSRSWASGEERRGRPVEPFELTVEEKQTLELWSRGRTVSQALARRARIVLARS